MFWDKKYNYNKFYLKKQLYKILDIDFLFCNDPRVEIL